MSNLLNRRNTSADVSSSTVCQSCKRFEIDLTTASDNLHATDAELKASRQVISLLQRQLELFQIEKEGLEKLVVSQSKGSSPGINFSRSNVNEDDLVGNEFFKDLESRSPDEIQKNLLKLIKTQLYAKDEEIVKLKFNLKEAQNAAEQLRVQMHMLEDDVSSLRSENMLLKENLVLRDQTIVQLSSEVFEQSNSDTKLDKRRQSSAEVSLLSRIDLNSQQRQITKLGDTLEAYKKTNELLSTNVVRLTEKCSQSERKEIEARSQCHELEAKCCQIQSKLLSLLKEIEQSSKPTTNISEGEGPSNEKNDVIHNESVRLLIKRLLEDRSLDIPLSWKEGNKSKRTNDNMVSPKEAECDELGFYIATPRSDNNRVYHQYQTMSPPGSNKSSPISSTRTRASRVLRRGLSEMGAYHSVHNQSLASVGEELPQDISVEGTSDIYQQSVDSTKSDELTWRLKWDEFIKSFDLIDLSKSKEFKQLLRSGVPQDYRCKVWKALIDLKVGKERQKLGNDYYQSLLEPRGEKQTNTTAIIQNPSSKQIELDLLRTLPNNKYFETIDSTGTVRLRRVLVAFAAHKPQVGYCQGMNRLAAVALLVLPEEEAFWCLVAIVDKIMPIGYYNDLWLAQVDSNVVMEFIAIKLPQLSDHFKKYGIELSLFAWFLTIFVDGTPPAFFLRLWDCFLYEGDKILFRVALAILKRNENELMKINNSVVANNFIRSTISSSIDIDSFMNVAFEWANPLPSRILRQKREQNFQSMKSSLKKLTDTQHQPTSGASGTERGEKSAAHSSEADDVSDRTDSPQEESSIISI